MFRKIMLVSALVAAPAFAQQNTDISGANFQAGKADATLAELGRRAASSGSKLVITAPPDWHARIAAKVRAGGNADIVLRDGFYENVLVRVQDGSMNSANEEPDRSSKAEADKSKAEAVKARAEADRFRAEAEKARADAENSRAEAAQAKAEAETAKAQVQQATARAAAKPAVTPTAAAQPRAPTAATAANDTDAARDRLQQSLNNGRSALATLTVASLQPGDTLYVDGQVKAVTRREGRQLAFYWVDGELDLRRSELRVLAPNQYQVTSMIRGEGALRREFGSAATSLDAREPEADAPARLALETSLNEGNTISQTVQATDLRSGDLLYANGNAVAVVRLQGRDLSRYWLVGSLDLQQTGVQADGANRYKVLSDTVR